MPTVNNTGLDVCSTTYIFGVHGTDVMSDPNRDAIDAVGTADVTSPATNPFSTEGVTTGYDTALVLAFGLSGFNTFYGNLTGSLKTEFLMNKASVGNNIAFQVGYGYVWSAGESGVTTFNTVATPPSGTAEISVSVSFKPDQGA
jgi:hypothetical protein